jgi:hypothetical protein
MSICMLLTSILSSFFICIICKSIDPDGLKAGVKDGEKTATVIVDDDHVNRFINMCDYWIQSKTRREEAIACITPYVDSKQEETYLHLQSLVLKSLPDEVDCVAKMMETWEGRYDEMFVMIDKHIRDSQNDKALLLENAAMVIDNDDLSTSQSITGPPPLQITSCSPPAVIKMDTTRDAKLRRETISTAFLL